MDARLTRIHRTPSVCANWFTPYTERGRNTVSQLVRRQSQLAGILYLVTHITSVTAVIAYGGGFVRAGVALELVLLAFGCLGTGVLLSGCCCRRAVLPERRASPCCVPSKRPSSSPGRFRCSERRWPAPAVDGTSAATHTAAFLLGQGLVISVNTVILGWLLWDARAVPRALAALGMTGGVVVLVSNGLQLAGAIPLNGVVAQRDRRGARLRLRDLVRRLAHRRRCAAGSRHPHCART